MNVSNSKQVLRAGHRSSNISFGAVVFSLAVIGVLNGAQANAQTAAQAAEIVKSFSGSSQAVVKRLTELDQLPGGGWRFHWPTANRRI